MAPEMIKQEPYDKTLDYYSLGIVLYELLIGKAPFYSAKFNFEDIKSMILNQEILFPKNQISKLAMDLIYKLTIKDLTKRIGFSLGFNEIVSHPWLSNIRLERIKHKNIKAPITPNFYELNFDNEFLEKDIKKLEVCSQDDSGNFGMFDKFFNFSFSIENHETRFSTNSLNMNKAIAEEYEIISIPDKNNSEKLPSQKKSKMKLRIFNKEFQKELEFLSSKSKHSNLLQKNCIFEEDFKTESTPTIQKVYKSKHKHVGEFMKKDDEVPFIDNDLSSIKSSNFNEQNKKDPFLKRDYEDFPDGNEEDDEIKKINTEFFRNIVKKKSSSEEKKEIESSYHTAISDNNEMGTFLHLNLKKR